MRKLAMIVGAAAALMLAACGSDTLSTTGSSGGGGGTVSAVAVTSSATSIAADGSTGATITATATDSSGTPVAGATITFTASAGTLSEGSGVTGTTGTVTTTLTAGTAASGTVITVTGADGTITGNATVSVGSTQQSVTVITSVPSIPSDSSKSATITALVRNAQNQFVAGVPVTFSATSGGVEVTQGTTDASGSAIATLDAAGDPTNRTITVTATAGKASATVPVTVTGTSLTVTGSTNLVLNSQGVFTVSLTESGGTTGIANTAVALSSANGNTLSAATVTTSANGQATFTVTAIKGGADTITAKALSLTAAQAVAVSTQNFAFTSPAVANARLDLGATSTLTVKWTSNGVPATGQIVSFSATRGTLSAPTATVLGDGTASVTITSSPTNPSAGPSVITATGTGVTAQASLDFIATDPNSISLQASPSTIATQGLSTITATVRDPNNNLVEGQVVDFAIVKDPTGGTVSVASATTNVQGQATTVYTASTTTSASNGIEISGTAAGFPAVTGSTTLTVGGESVFLSLGTGNTISTYPPGATGPTTQYEYPYSVQAIDAAGNGVNGVTVTFTVTSLGYFKGFESWNGTDWLPPNYSTAFSDPDAYVLGYPGCLSEDLANNGILTPAEDYNGNGKLDPGLVVSTDVGSAVTAGGTANVNLIYPKDHAYWVAVKLTATATVSGNQSSASTAFILPGLAGDYTTQTVSPPGQTSPYGIANTCKDPN